MSRPALSFLQTSPILLPNDFAAMMVSGELRESCALDKLGNDGLIISGKLGCKRLGSK